MNAFLGRLHHKTPSWVDDDALFHVRIRVNARQPIALNNSGLVGELLSAAQRYHNLGKWRGELFLIMPDHVHAMLAFPGCADLSVLMRDWKRGTARFQHVDWQDNFFDHRMRDRKESTEIWNYIRRNPVVKGLCTNESEWAWWWSGTLEKESTLTTTRST